MNLKQKVKVYLISFMLTPLGLYWFFKYFRHEDKEVKKVGYTALMLTLAALVISYFVIYEYVQVYSSYFDLYKANMDVYSQLGY